MKAYRLRQEINGIEEPPGKTWFWELQAGVIDAGRCIQCGTCVAACPSNSLGIDQDTDLPELVKMCTGCSLCWDFCPRGGLRYEALWPPSTIGAEAGDDRVAAEGAVVRVDASDTYWKITGGPPGDGLGAVIESYAVRAGARPDHAQDGGVVTALLIAALAGGEIDGALVTRPSDDPDEPWKGVAHLATRRKRSPRRPAATTTRPWPWPSWTSPGTTFRPSRASPWWAPPVRSRASGPCSPGAGPPVPTGSTRWC